MSQFRSKNEYWKHVIVHCAWFCMLLSTYLPATAQADLCVSTDDEKERRTKVAYVVAGLTVIGLAAGIACLGTSSGHHKHHERYSGMSSVDNYRPYSDSSSDHYSDYSDYSNEHHHHHSGYYSSNPYSIFSENNVSSFSGGSDSIASDNRVIRGKACRPGASKAGEECSLSGHFIVQPTFASKEQKNVIVFVQLPDGSSRSLGTVSLSGNASLSYGPFQQKGTYTFGVSLDHENASSAQLKLGSIQIEVNGSEVLRHDFTAPPYAPSSYEPTPCCYDLN